MLERIFVIFKNCSAALLVPSPTQTIPVLRVLERLLLKVVQSLLAKKPSVVPLERTIVILGVDPPEDANGADAVTFVTPIDDGETQDKLPVASVSNNVPEAGAVFGKVNV